MLIKPAFIGGYLFYTPKNLIFIMNSFGVFEEKKCIFAPLFTESIRVMGNLAITKA